MPGLAVAALFVLGTVALIWLSYLAARMLFPRVEDDSRELAGSVMFRISALHGLILALVFANQMVEYRQLEAETVEEASALADVFYDADRIGADTLPEIQSAVVRYLGVVTTEEWSLMADTGQLSSAAWDAWESLYQLVLDLPAETPRQASLRNQMLSDVHTVASARDRRASHGHIAEAEMFWIAAVVGVVLIAMAYHGYSPTRHNLLLLGLFGAYTGLVMFFIYAFSNPFAPPGGMSPEALYRLSDSIGAG